MQMINAIVTIMPFMVCLFWTAVLLIDWRAANPARRLLAVFMGTGAVLYFCHAVFFNHESTLLPVADVVYSFCNLAVFPLYYLYICRLTDTRGITLRRLSLLLPALGIALWSGLDVLGGNPLASGVPTARILVARVLFLVLLFYVCFLGYRRLKAFDRLVEDYFSDSEHRSLTRIRNIMSVLVACSLCSAVASLVGRDHFIDQTWMLAIPSLLFSSLLFSVGYAGREQEFCIDDLCLECSEPSVAAEGEPTAQAMHQTPVEGDGMAVIIPPPTCVAPVEQPSEAPSALSVSVLMQRLETLMAEEEPWMQPDLRLSTLAARLNVGRSTLSACINTVAGMSFSDYVNTFRLRRAKALMSENHQGKTLSTAQIAERSGFSGENALYRSCRKLTGKTPKQLLFSDVLQ